MKGGILMLKFQTEYNTYIKTFEDFILTTFVIIDDLYKKFAPYQVAHRRNFSIAKLSDSENARYSFVKRNYHHLFPNLCNRSRFNRTRRSLLQTTELIRQKLISLFNIPLNKYFIVDSFPFEVCKFGRTRYSRCFRAYGADYGRCPSKKEVYFGYKVHAMITLEGYITNFEITPASTDDRDGLRDMLENETNMVIIGDKGYISEKLSDEMKCKGICVMALKRSNSKNNWTKPIRQLIFKLRRRVETVFSQLSLQLNSERVLAKSFQGLCTRLVILLEYSIPSDTISIKFEYDKII